MISSPKMGLSKDHCCNLRVSLPGGWKYTVFIHEYLENILWCDSWDNILSIHDKNRITVSFHGAWSLRFRDYSFEIWPWEPEGLKEKETGSKKYRPESHIREETKMDLFTLLAELQLFSSSEPEGLMVKILVRDRSTLGLGWLASKGLPYGDQLKFLQWTAQHKTCNERRSMNIAFIKVSYQWTIYILSFHLSAPEKQLAWQGAGYFPSVDFFLSPH